MILMAFRTKTLRHNGISTMLWKVMTLDYKKQSKKKKL